MIDIRGYTEHLLARARRPDPKAVYLVKKACGDDLTGYLQILPPNDESVLIDLEVANLSSCDQCDRLGMAYVAMTAWSDLTRDEGCDSYRAFAVCTACGNVVEF